MYIFVKINLLQSSIDYYLTKSLEHLILDHNQNNYENLLPYLPLEEREKTI